MDKSTKLVWTQVDESKLSEQDAKLLAISRKKAQEAKAAKDAFNAAFLKAVAAKIPADHEMVVGHNFGKLSVAIAPKGFKATKGSSKPLFTF